jgi:hypothetical protein
MNIINHVRRGPGPNPGAVTAGLVARRVGWGRWSFSGLPAHMAGYVRREPDALDLAVIRMAGMAPTAVELAAVAARTVARLDDRRSWRINAASRWAA